MVNPSLHHFLPGSSWPIQERPKRGSDVSQLTPSCRNARMNSSTSYIYIYIHIIQYTLLKTHCWSVFVCFLVSLNPICICSFHKKSTATAPKAKLRVTNPQPSRQPTSHGHHRAGIKKKHNQDSRFINWVRCKFANQWTLKQPEFEKVEVMLPLKVTHPQASALKIAPPESLRSWPGPALETACHKDHYCRVITIRTSNLWMISAE